MSDDKLIVFPKVEPKGKAATLLPEIQRDLPGELITKDEADVDRVHPLDPPHIKSALVYEHQKKLDPKAEKEDEAVKKLTCAQPGEKVPLSQHEIDVIRCRVIYTWINRELSKAACGEKVDTEIKHLYFPEPDNVNSYALRKGRPRDWEKSYRHQKHLDTVVDIFELPPRIKDFLAAKGIKHVNFRKRFEDAERQRAIDEQRIVLARDLGVLR